MHKDPTLHRQMGLVYDIQPRMPVDARAFIEPALILTGICPHHHRVLSMHPEEVGDIVGRTAISAEMSPQVTVVDPDLAVPEDAVKLQDEPLAGILPIDLERLPVPPNRILRKQGPHRMITMHIDVIVPYMLKRKTNRPIMRQLHRRPAPVVKTHLDTGTGGIPRLGKDIPNSVVEIPVRISGMTKVKPPAIIKIQAFAERLSRCCYQTKTSQKQK